MQGNFDACLAVTLSHEGGWSDHAKDPGGATMKGITLATFRSYKPFATKQDLRAISDDDVRRIYAKGYWHPVAGDLLPAGVDLAVFDYGVNSGPARAAKCLQGVVGMAGKAVDGKIGPVTLNRLNGTSTIDTVKAVCSKRLSFMQGLKIYSTFGKGWARRVADVEVSGVKMALAVMNASPTAIKATMASEASAAEKRAAQRNQAAVSTSGAGVAAGGGSTMLDMGDVNWWIVGGVALVAVAAIAFLRSRASVHSIRAEAYRDAMS